MKGNLKKRLVVSVIVLTAILAIGSCTVSVSGPSYIRISNTSPTYSITHANIVNHNSGTWGNNLLAPYVISPFSAANFEVNPGFYDVWVTDNTYPIAFNWYVYDVQVTSGNTTTLYYTGTTFVR